MSNSSDQSPQHDAAQSGSLELRNFPDDMSVVQEQVIAAAAAHHYPEASMFAIRLALEEAISNAFRHGNKLDPRLHVDVSWSVGPHSISITVEDQGEGFDPESLPDPTDESRLDLPSGRGVLLINAYMTEVHYSNRGTRVTMTYKRPS